MVAEPLRRLFDAALGLRRNVPRQRSVVEDNRDRARGTAAFLCYIADGNDTIVPLAICQTGAPPSNVAIDSFWREHVTGHEFTRAGPEFTRAGPEFTRVIIL